MRIIKEWHLNAEMKDGSALRMVINGKARFTDHHVFYQSASENAVGEFAINLDYVNYISCTGYFTEEKQ